MQINRTARRPRSTKLDKITGLVRLEGKGPNGVDLFFVRVKDGRSETGRLLYKKFGPVTKDRVAEIADKAEAYRKGREEQHKPRVTGKLHKRTLGEWLEIWIENVVRADAAASSYDHYKLSLRHYLLANSIAQVALADLTQERVEIWRGELDESGVGRPSINYALARLKGALEIAIEPARFADNGISINVARKVKPLKVAATVPWIGKPEETVAITQAIGPSYMQALVQFATDTGARRSEIAALTWGDLDLERGTLTFKRHMTVSGHGEERMVRIAPGTKTSKGAWATLNLSDQTIAMLRQTRERLLEHKLATREWKAGRATRATFVATSNDRTGTPYIVPQNPIAADALVFPYWDGSPWDVTTLGNWFVRMAEKAGIKGKSIHDLRHDCATFLIGLGVPLTVVADHMRHKDASLTAKVYVHLLASQDRLAVATQNRIWSALYAAEQAV